MQRTTPRAGNASPVHPPWNGVVHGVCPHDCPDACSLLCRVEAGRLAAVEGNPAHPVTRGFVCRKLATAPERVYGVDRLRYPLQRVGPKGGGGFRRISWPAAIDAISARWRHIIDEVGPGAILPFYGSGTEGLVQGRIAGKRFFNRLGTRQLERTICTKAGRIGYRYTMGTSVGADPSAIGDADLVIEWGANTAVTNIHHRPFLREARKNGAPYVIVNPIRVRGAAQADLWLAPHPGTDAALALGLMHLIVEASDQDQAFLDGASVGFEALRERLAVYTPEQVERITGVGAADLRRLARLYAERRRAFIYVGPGCQRHSNAGMTLRTLACLPALTGAWRYPGCGLYFPTSTIFPVDWSALEGEDLRPTPPAAYNMIHLGRLLEDADPPIRSLYVFNGNPATVLYDQARVRRGLARNDLFTVVHEQYLTDTAKYADIVLPATTQFEHPDLHASYYHYSVLLNRPAIEPVGECRSNLDTFRALARAMGFSVDPCLAEDAWDTIRAALAVPDPALANIDLDGLLDHGWARAQVESVDARVRDGRLPTPSGRIELYSETMARDGFDPLPAYLPLRESSSATPALFERYPLYFLTPSAQASLNSNYAQHVGSAMRGFTPKLTIHPSDAAARGIADGDEVRVRNDRGACRLHAVVSDQIRPGVVASAGLWWDRHHTDACNANHTTPDFTADMGGGSAFNTNLVEVERLANGHG